MTDRKFTDLDSFAHGGLVMVYTIALLVQKQKVQKQTVQKKIIQKKIILKNWATVVARIFPVFNLDQLRVSLPLSQCSLQEA